MKYIQLSLLQLGITTYVWLVIETLNGNALNYYLLSNDTNQDPDVNLYQCVFLLVTAFVALPKKMTIILKDFSVENFSVFHLNIRSLMLKRFRNFIKI